MHWTGSIGQAFEEQPQRLQGKGLAPHALVERSPDAAPGESFGRGNEIEVAELQLWLVHQKRESQHAAGSLGHKQDRTESLLEGVAELVGQLVDILRTYGGETSPEDFLDLVGWPDG